MPLVSCYFNPRASDCSLFKRVPAVSSVERRMKNGHQNGAINKENFNIPKYTYLKSSERSMAKSSLLFG